MGPSRGVSLSARERNNPPPRRKACSACIKAKRRCDLAAPCLRCERRGIPCEYAGKMAPESVSADCVDFSALEASPLMCDGAANFITETDAALYDEYCALESVASLQLLAPTTAELYVQNVIAKKLQFALEEIKDAPRMMITETQTPWSHALLYKECMPKTMRDAHASCALYMAKNSVNAPIIMQAIETRVAEQLSVPVTTSSFLETLAHTQSLILYQIMRLLDGDISSRAAAERAIPDLEESAMYLLARVRFDIAIEEDLAMVAPTKAMWRDWIMHESARRTVLFCFFFIKVYRLLAGCTDLTCDGRLGLCHSWTVSRHLWTAGTLADFARAWRDRKHFVVRDARFDPVLLEANADDVDRFGKMFISTLIGVDEAEVWFEARGGRLRDG